MKVYVATSYQEGYEDEAEAETFLCPNGAIFVSPEAAMKAVENDVRDEWEAMCEDYKPAEAPPVPDFKWSKEGSDKTGWTWSLEIEETGESFRVTEVRVHG